MNTHSVSSNMNNKSKRESPASSVAQKKRKTRKRRSKHDKSERNYICGCGKSYLSYAALYTHAKTKHNGNFPDGTTTLNKKKQGRPKKEDSFSTRSYSMLQKRQAYARDFRSFLQMIPGALMQPTAASENVGLRAQFNGIDNESANEEPSYYNLLECFPDKLTMVEENLLDSIKNYMTSMEKEIIERHGEDFRESMDEVISGYVGKQINCNSTLALFAIYSSNFVSRDFFPELLIFLGYYRKVLNEKCWERYKENNPGTTFNEMLEYCEEESAEYAPDCSNVFILDYFPKFMKDGPFKDKKELKMLGLDSEKLLRVILMIKYLCVWLHINKFSDAKVTVNKSHQQST